MKSKSIIGLLSLAIIFSFAVMPAKASDYSQNDTEQTPQQEPAYDPDKNFEDSPADLQRWSSYGSYHDPNGAPSSTSLVMPGRPPYSPPIQLPYVNMYFGANFNRGYFGAGYNSPYCYNYGQCQPGYGYPYVQYPQCYPQQYPRNCGPYSGGGNWGGGWGGGWGQPYPRNGYPNRGGGWSGGRRSYPGNCGPNRGGGWGRGVPGGGYHRGRHGGYGRGGHHRGGNRGRRC